MNKLIAVTVALLSLVGCASPSQKSIDLVNSGDINSAQIHAQECANAGDSYCMNNLAVIVESHNGVIVGPETREEIYLSWYTLAARYGNPTAQQNLRRLGQPIPAADLYVQPAPQADNSAAWGILALGLLNGAAAYQDGTNQGRADANAIAREDDRVREQQRQDRINTQKITSSIDRLGW